VEKYKKNPLHWVWSIGTRTDNRLKERGFVSASVHWFAIGIWCTWICWDKTFSLIQKRSISIDFVREWRIGLWVTGTTLWLSHYKVGMEVETESSISKILIQVSYAATLAKHQNSTFIEDRATTNCFFDHQDPKLGPK